MKGWVCLMYHDVGGEREAGSGGPEHFRVPTAAFARQLDQIADLGWAGRSIAEASEAAPGAVVAISFDDGEAGQFAHAFPALAARDMTATFFVTTSWVDRPGYVSWSQLREMKAAGMSIQSHTHTHPFLSELDAATLAEELRASKGRLDECLEQDTDAIALPGGDFPRRGLRGLIGSAGFRTVATSRWGVNRPATGATGVRLVRRCTVRGAPSRRSFGRLLRADPWLVTRRRLRESALGALRSALGPTRYARWRRRFLDARAGTA